MNAAVASETAAVFLVVPVAGIVLIGVVGYLVARAMRRPVTAASPRPAPAATGIPRAWGCLLGLVTFVGMASVTLFLIRMKAPKGLALFAVAVTVVTLIRPLVRRRPQPAATAPPFAPPPVVPPPVTHLRLARGFTGLMGLILFVGMLPLAAMVADESGYIPPVVLAALVGVVVVTAMGTRGIWQVVRPKPQPAREPAPPPSTPPAPPRECPKCRQPIAAGAPAGLCPRCLLYGAMASEPRLSPTIAYVSFEPPSVEEVAALFPHLEVVRLIGAGGMGAVYLARQPALDRPVAVKLLRPHADDPTFAERFAREARAMARLSHPNVVTIYESGEAGGVPYLVMEYVDGVTLRDAMRDRSLTPAEVLAIIPQLCDALDYAHACGVVHRDVKPENILLDKTGRARIADFGLAKVADPAGVSLTHTRQAMGTPHYMAPEQWERPTEVDHRADIYALGVVLYELLTGELPLGRFDPPSQKIRVDVRVDEVVLRALAKEPDRRYQHASDVKNDLARARADRPGGWVRGRSYREYRSRATFLGWPLVHIVSGRDPATGLPKVAKGWLAVGSGAAVGGVAVAGGAAVGGIAVSGGLSVGVVSLAGMAVGLAAAFGGAALGGLVAAGGAAVSGVLAIGGAAVGRFAIGGGAAGEYVISGTRHDADFWEKLGDFAEKLMTGGFTDW